MATPDIPPRYTVETQLTEDTWRIRLAREDEPSNCDTLGMLSDVFDRVKQTCDAISDWDDERASIGRVHQRLKALGWTDEQSMLLMQTPKFNRLKPVTPREACTCVTTPVGRCPIHHRGHTDA